jgi:DNA-binding MarR family transcriptional regulator
MSEAADHDQGERRQAPMTVRVSDRDVAEARRLLSLLADADSDARGGASPSAKTDSSSGELLGRARAILAVRRQRETIFKKAIFGEPAWDMLLLLYIGTSESRRTIGRLGELARISKSTALRWIDYLDRQGLVRREQHPTDRRAVFVELTPKGRQAIDLYLSGTFPLTE